MTKQADAKRLHVAVERMCMQAGTNTAETVEWLCGPYSGMAKLFTKYFSPDTKTQSFSEKYPSNPDAKCKCEHWEACIDCHPTYIAAVEARTAKEYTDSVISEHETRVKRLRKFLAELEKHSEPA